MMPQAETRPASKSKGNAAKRLSCNAETANVDRTKAKVRKTKNVDNLRIIVIWNPFLLVALGQMTQRFTHYRGLDRVVK